MTAASSFDPSSVVSSWIQLKAGADIVQQWKEFSQDLPESIHFKVISMANA